MERMVISEDSEIVVSSRELMPKLIVSLRTPKGYVRNYKLNLEIPPEKIYVKGRETPPA